VRDDEDDDMLSSSPGKECYTCDRN
jgi:hypothetical protein